MFQSPGWLWWLAAVPALLALYALGERRRRAAMAAFGRAERLVPPEAGARRAWRAGLRAAAAALLLLALAGPQWGVELVTTQSSARSVLVAVDVSRSMGAEDVRPSRLDKAKAELSLLIDELAGERVGVLAFAGRAGLMCPLTTDRDAAKQALQALEIGAVPGAGSAIGSAVREGVKLLSRHGGGKALVLLTDGEDHRTDPLGAAEEAREAGVRLYIVGIGTPEGEPIPERDASGRVTGYVKDARGATVVSKLGEDALLEMAKRAGGAYYRATPGEAEASEIAQALRGLAAAPGRASSQNRYKNRFQLPLGLAFLLLLAELLVPLSGPRRLPLPLRTALALLLAAPALGASTESELRKGNALYEKGRYDEALPHYERAQKKGDPRPAFNAGAALYRLEEYRGAAEAFETSKAGPAAAYNRGNALLKAGDARGAVKEFRRAVTAAPEDADARHNLAVALKRLKQPPQQQPKSGGGGGQSKQPPPEARTRPQSPGQGGGGQLPREDAERLLRAVEEKERSADRKAVRALPRGQGGEGGEDW